MKVGDLVVLRGDLFSSWEHTNENAVVVEIPDRLARVTSAVRYGGPGGFFVMFGNGDILDYSGYEDHFEVLS